MNTLERAAGHLKTISRHKRLVMRYCFRAGLYKQGLTHDLSKYSPTEFIPGVKYFQGNRSPNTAERSDIGYSSAWLHHKGRNKHHIDYWMDYSDRGDHKLRPVEMPLKYVIEMFCDRIAASRVYKKNEYTDASPYEYYQRSSDHYIIHPNTDKLLIRLLIILKNYGEDKAFAYCRYLLRKEKEKASSGR